MIGQRIHIYEKANFNCSEQYSCELTQNYFCYYFQDVTTQLGQTESFEAIVQGTPRPEVVWLRDGAEIKKGKRVLFEEEAIMEPPGHKYKMTIRDIVMKDFGKVRNFVINFKYDFKKRNYIQ